MRKRQSQINQSNFVRSIARTSQLGNTRFLFVAIPRQSGQLFVRWNGGNQVIVEYSEVPPSYVAAEQVEVTAGLESLMDQHRSTYNSKDRAHYGKLLQFFSTESAIKRSKLLKILWPGKQRPTQGSNFRGFKQRINRRFVDARINLKIDTRLSGGQVTIGFFKAVVSE